MQKHSLLFATLLGILLPLSAVGREPLPAEDQDEVGTADTQNSTVDENGTEPVYSPGQSLPPPYRGGYPDGGYPGGGYGGGGYGEYGGGPGCGCCGDCGCDDCGCCCTPCCCGHITARANGLFLKRESPSSVPLISSLATGLPLLDANQ